MAWDLVKHKNSSTCIIFIHDYIVNVYMVEEVGTVSGKLVTSESKSVFLMMY